MTSIALELSDQTEDSPAHVVRSGLVARVHSTADQLQALRSRWRALEDVAPGASVFQGDAWSAQVAAARGVDGAAILTVSDGDDLVALLPLRISTGAAGRVATGLGEPFQQYSEMLLAPGYDGAAALRLMIAALRADARPDAIMLRKVRVDSTLHAAMAGFATSGHASPFVAAEAGAAPFVDLAPYPDFADFHATVSFKSRKNLRNARNRLARNGELTVLVDDQGEGLAAAIAGSHAGRLDWLDREGQVSRAFADPAFETFLAALAKPEVTGLGVIAVTIKAGDTPVAYQWGFVHKKRYYAYIASWAPEYEEFSPGKMIMEEVLRACHARGIEVADFLMPASRYKFTWATGAVDVTDWSAPLTVRGRMIALWNSRLRPALKALYVKLPAPVRTLARKVLTRGE